MNTSTQNIGHVTAVMHTKYEQPEGYKALTAEFNAAEWLANASVQQLHNIYSEHKSIIQFINKNGTESEKSSIESVFSLIHATKTHTGMNIGYQVTFNAKEVIAWLVQHRPDLFEPSSDICVTKH